MSKITFRADDDLVEDLEALEASKSEAMRDALRMYLGASGQGDSADAPTVESDPIEAAERDVTADATGEPAIDDIVRKRVDDLLTERLAELGYGRGPGRDPVQQPTRARTNESRAQDVNVTIALEGATAHRVEDADSDRAEHDHSEQDQTPTHQQTREPGRQGTTCGQCGEHVDGEHVYCPNCGEKAAQRLFCECSDELRSDWAFCPSCGRRTPSADVLESNSRRS